MCGIVGELALGTGHVDAERVRRRNALIRHRGPDGAGEWVALDGRCALAMRRLAIIDLAGGDQPMRNEDGSVWLVFNGEVYNHAELRTELVQRGHRFRSDHSDTEVVVHGWEEWGEGVLERLRGMFGLALWDTRAGSLLLARDRLGKKPLYWAQAGGRLVFGSELRTMLADDAVSGEADVAALDRYLQLDFVPAPYTVLRGVSRLPAGHRLLARDGRVDVAPYWRPPLAPHGGAGIEESVERLEALLEDAVRRRMISDVPVGAFLSGGLDSSLVVALAQRLTNRPLRTFSVGFRDPELDESTFAAGVAAAIGSEHTGIVVDDVDAALVDRVLAALDEPHGDPAAVPTFVVSELASRSVKVVLTGEGGDEVFAGYETYRREDALSPLLRLPAPLRRIATAPLAGLEAWSLHLQRIRAIVASDAAHWHTTFGTRLHAAGRRRLYGRDLRERIASAAATNGHDGAWRALGPVAGAMVQDLGARLPDGLLMKVDKMTMAHGLEARTPLLDHDLVEFSLGLPSSLHHTAATGKLLLKRVAERLLPAEIVHRRKHPFDTPIGAWLRGPLHAVFREARETLAAQGFDRLELERIARLVESGDPHAQHPGWMLFVLGRWLGAHGSVRIR